MSAKKPTVKKTVNLTTLRAALDPGTTTLLARQENLCPHCRDPLLDARHPPASAVSQAHSGPHSPSPTRSRPLLPT